MVKKHMKNGAKDAKKSEKDEKHSKQNAKDENDKDVKKDEEDEKDDRNNQKDDHTEEKEAEAVVVPGKGQEGKEKVLLEVKQEEVESPTSFASQQPKEVQPFTTPEQDDDESDEKVKQKWRQHGGDSAEDDDEEIKSKLKEAMHDDGLATDDPYMKVDDESLSATSPWQRRVEKRKKRDNKKKGLDTTALPHLPAEKPELEEIQDDELEKDEARSRGTHGCEK